MTDQIPDGVWLNLPESVYFAQDALGTTDLATLFEHREGWWWQSRYNQVHGAPDNESRAKDFGSALHTLLLEGRDAYIDAYHVMPEKRSFPGLLVTAEDIQRALAKGGHPIPAAKTPKPRLLEYARQYLSHLPVWDLIVEQAAEAGAGKIAIDARDDADLQIMREVALSHPVTSHLLEPPGAVRLAEVSVFATIEIPGLPPVRCRNRFDALFPMATLDLKTVGFTPAGFDTEIARRLSDWKMRLQAGWSFVMRQKLNKHIAAGRLFNAAESDPHAKQKAEWLGRFPKEAPPHLATWVWLFAQRPSQTGLAPIIQPVTMTRDNPIVTEGIQAAREALEFFAPRQDKLGDWRAWASSRHAVALSETAGNDLQPGEIRAFSPRIRPNPQTPAAAE